MARWSAVTHAWRSWWQAYNLEGIMAEHPALEFIRQRLRKKNRDHLTASQEHLAECRSASPEAI
jgi:hypothetical protein